MADADIDRLASSLEPHGAAQASAFPDHDVTKSFCRHCEERSDEAIEFRLSRGSGLLRCARNDGEGTANKSRARRKCRTPRRWKTRNLQTPAPPPSPRVLPRGQSVPLEFSRA